MRVSLINMNLVAKDAIGSCIIAQARFFLRRGDVVQIFTELPAEGAPGDLLPYCRAVDLKELREDRDGTFAASDVYIYHYGNYHSLMNTITQVDGGLVIFYYHNVTPPELWNWEPDRAALRRGVEGLTLASHADLILADSAFNLAQVAPQAKLPPERLIVLPLPVDTSTFRPGPAPDDLRRAYGLGDGPVLLYVGRMASNKRIDLLVELLAAVRRHPRHPQPDARLLLVGDHNSAPAYRMETERALTRARALGVDGSIVFAGRVDRLPDHYRLASVYVTASQHEGFCVPLIEAMASGVPIVAAANTALPETLGEAGRLVPVSEPGEVDIAAMADAVASILTDQEAAEDLRQRGLARAVEFSIERYNEQLSTIINTHCVNLPLRVQPAPHVQMAEAAGGPALAVAQSAQAAAAQTDGEVAGGALFWPELAKEAYVAMPEYTVRSKLLVVGRLVAWVRRNLTSHLKEPYLDLIIQRQQAFNLRSAFTINELTRRISLLSQQTNEIGELLRHVEMAQEQLQLRLDAQAKDQAATFAGLLRAESHIARVEGRVAEAGRAADLIPVAAPLTATEAPLQQAYGINYLRCNEAVGGDPEIERALYEPFVPLFEEHARPVLDLGCGRGVFLRLMLRHGISASGVDVDADMVAYCREQGLNVEEGDVFDYLARQTDGSLGGIFCAHVVEHLPRTRLMELADLCWRKLEEGGAMVWITPHGGSLSALHATFYKDLTHTRPLHPDLLAFILEANGFQRVKTMTLSDMPEESKLRLLPEEGADEAARVLNTNFIQLNRVIFGHLDCAAIGWR